jgi:hypothetical protein
MKSWPCRIIRASKGTGKSPGVAIGTLWNLFFITSSRRLKAKVRMSTENIFASR